MRASVLLQVLLPLCVCGQTYVPITEEGSRWLYHGIYSGAENLFPLEYGADTAINGALWKRIGGGAMLDDNGRVWYMDLDPWSFPNIPDSTPIRLYDFTLSIGDSFAIPIDTMAHVHVLAKDSVQLLDGSYRDRLILEQGHPTTGHLGCDQWVWIEGIGEPDYLFAGIEDCFEHSYWLECYGINNMPLYGSCVYLGSEEDVADDPVRLWVTNVTGRFGFDIGRRHLDAIRVFDLQGRAMATNIENGTVEMSMSAFGFYFIAIQASGQVATFKMTARVTE